jgi:hypothetical protein
MTWFRSWKFIATALTKTPSKDPAVSGQALKSVEMVVIVTTCMAPVLLKAASTEVVYVWPQLQPTRNDARNDL